MPASNTPAVDPFNGLESCSALERHYKVKDFRQRPVNTAGGDNGCGTDKAQYGGVTLALQPNLEIEDLNADKSKQSLGDVRGRPSIETRNAIGVSRQCDIATEVTRTSRAFVVTALSTGTTEDACNFANKVAMEVESQLPKIN